MSSVNKNQIEVGHYVVIQHTHGVIESELAGIVDQYLSHELTDIIIKEKVEKYVD